MPTTRTPLSLLVAGELLEGRFRVVHRVPSSGAATVWCAHDEVLARPVALKVLPADRTAGPGSAGILLEAAMRSGAVVHPGLARVHDAFLLPRPGGPALAVVISEWVDGRALDLLLATGPLEPAEAVALLRQAAEALAAVHAHDLVHGRVHPGNVLVGPGGRLKLTDAAVAAAVHGAPTPGPASDGGVERDTRDLAAVLFALLTARWPGGTTDQPAGRLPGAPGVGRGVPRPRQLRAAVPRSLDAVVVRALDPGAPDPRAPDPRALSADIPLTTPALLSAAAQQAAAEAQEQGATTPVRTRGRHVLPALLLLLLLSSVGTGGWLLGLAVGDLPRRADAVEAVVSTGSSPSPSPPPAAAAPLDLGRLPVRDYDPPPGDGSENPRDVPLTVDGNLDTSWLTSTYRTADFGRLKHGVGLLVDLGRSRPLTQVQVLLTRPGASLELRTADTVPATADGFRTVAVAAHVPVDAVLQPAAGAVGRYWLVWITALPADGNGFRAGVLELRFR